MDYGQASIVKSNMSMSLSYLEDEISKITSAINEIESLNRSYGKTSTITYGFKDRGKELYLNLMPRDALTFDINDIRRILKEDGLYNSESRKALSEYINYYKKMAPGVFKK